MKIFVGYHFAPEDAWVHDLVLPLVDAFGFEAVTGERTYGATITNAVIRRISESDGLIGFVTLRSGTQQTSRWVTDEIASGISAGIKVVEVREVGVAGQLGIAGDRQHIVYDPQHPEVCLVELATALGEWAKAPAAKTVRVIPEDVVKEIAPLLARRGLSCTYRWKVGPTTSDPQQVVLQPVMGGLMLDATDIPPSAYVQVEIVFGDKTWASDFEPIDMWNVLLAGKEA